MTIYKYNPLGFLNTSFYIRTSSAEESEIVERELRYMQDEIPGGNFGKTQDKVNPEEVINFDDRFLINGYGQ